MGNQALAAAGPRRCHSVPLSSRGPNPSKLIQQFMTLRPDQQLHIFNTLRSHLTEKGVLTDAAEN